ncbi:hypothetical protein [Mesorhizobium sp. M1348]|uniref:hypothetical protein n=1 Tax=unclassified Mesorhizobium TaxID=325217 RepID=UPI00333AEC58
MASELTDDSQSVPGTPPSLLSIRDGKSGYDVTAAATAFATFNVLSYRRTPDEVLGCFDRLCADAASACLVELKRRRHRLHGSNAIDLAETIPLKPTRQCWTVSMRKHDQGLAPSARLLRPAISRRPSNAGWLPRRHGD